MPGFWGPELWPPNSPQINPLDKAVWAYLQTRVNSTSHKNIKTLKTSIRKHWNQMPEDDSHHYHGSLSLGPGLSLQSYLDGDLKSPECQNTSMDEEKASRIMLLSSLAYSYLRELQSWPTTIADAHLTSCPWTKLGPSKHDGIVSSSSSTNSTSTSNMSSGAVNRPSLSLAHKMKGFRQDVQKRFSRLRSRSAERISQRSMMGRSPERSLPDPESPKVSGGHILPSPTLASQETVYNGPFLGRARALVDYTPSPYDKDALRFKRGDVIDIISMNPSGLWKGKCQNRVGNFKFINVEILPHPRSQSQPREASRQVSSPERTRECHYRQASDPHHHKKAAGHLDRDDLGEEAGERGRKGSHGVGAPSQRVNRPKTVDELLKKIGLEEHISVFVLNGYEDLDSFQDMDEAELDYLGITNHQHRAKLMTAVQLLQDTATIHSGESSDVDVNGSPTKSPSKSNPSETFSRGSGFRRLSFPRDSGCFASSENLPSHGHHRSSPASDRSSHSGVSSHPESGIHIPEGAEGSSSLSSSDDDTITSSHNLSPMKRSADQVAKARSLRDRHTANMDELEFTREMLSSANRRGSKFDSLVEKYSDKKRPNFELQFKSARSVFEQNNSRIGGLSGPRIDQGSTLAIGQGHHDLALGVGDLIEALGKVLQELAILFNPHFPTHVWKHEHHPVKDCVRKALRQLGCVNPQCHISTEIQQDSSIGLSLFRHKMLLKACAGNVHSIRLSSALKKSATE
eukprot:maker-scaffold390_size186308-snap-gene-0.29 protein:Tk06347 transcript:maker-scaffold390_size186308-snap-gene-0.29-mRNA-1 annotation:"sam and sh3 domain-containing protein 3"